MDQDANHEDHEELSADEIREIRAEIERLQAEIDRGEAEIRRNEAELEKRMGRLGITEEALRILDRLLSLYPDALRETDLIHAISPRYPFRGEDHISLPIVPKYMVLSFLQEAIRADTPEKAHSRLSSARAWLGHAEDEEIRPRYERDERENVLSILFFTVLNIYWKKGEEDHADE